MENIIRTIDSSNADRYRFICTKSKPKTLGYQQKPEMLEVSNE